MRYSEPIWRIGDKLALFLWNQFSIERIWILRVAAATYLAHSIISYSFSQAVVHLILFTALLILDERKNKRPKAVQNSMSVSLRTSAVGIGFAVLIAIFTVVFVIQDVVLLDLGRISSDIAWLLYFLVKDALVSEEPPKRWKIKIPKFSFNNPLPQGA